ncbi:MAG: sulfur carrier protein ThiS [Muribaculaceae bacterium]|nr:sulfur carrier protein ThiS [Muribaculaceae bacterium]
MIIYVNSKPVEIDYSISVEELLNRQNVPSGGTAVAVNGKVVRRDNWADHLINDGAQVLIISAAYGG